MNETPAGERMHIGIFGRRNAGKSSLINALTGQDLSVVSSVKGTTTDPVKKAMELLPVGPVVLIDTPGLDDEGELGSRRVKKTAQILRQTDFALLVVEAGQKTFDTEKELRKSLGTAGILFAVVLNKTDRMEKDGARKDQETLEKERQRVSQILEVETTDVFAVSAFEKTGIYELKEGIGKRLCAQEKDRPLIRDLLSAGDFVVLVVPIDSAAPKGRLILPQQQVIRDALEAGAVPVVTRETELAQTLMQLGKTPAMVVTDSQVFRRVSGEVPREIPLTSFSILMSRYKGELSVQAAGARAVERLSDGDTVLIAEGCTHHRQCGDIGTVKLPAWIRGYTKKSLKFVFTSGVEFPDDLSGYALVVHCGGCMLNAREMKNRIAQAGAHQVPVTNYGMLIAYLHGIFERAIEPFWDFL